MREKDEHYTESNGKTLSNENCHETEQRSPRTISLRGILRIVLLLIGTVFVALTILVAVTELPEPNLPAALVDFIANQSLNPHPVPLPSSTDWVLLSYEEIPDTLKEAVVAVEDKRFYSHRGIELISIIRALVANLRAGEIVEGGSTITQQLAKNLFLTQERTLDRKFKEAVYSLKLEMCCSKEEILEMYINVIYFGHGTYGCEMASRFYFGKSVKDLDLAEAALLAGIIKGPEIYSPYHNLELAEQSKALVLDLMVQQGYINPHVAEQAKTEPVKIVGRPESNLFIIPINGWRA